MSKKWYKMQKSDDTVSMSIYGDIGYWGVSAADFKAELDALGDFAKMDIHIHSDGGEVTDGFAIYNMLKRVKAEKVITVDGIAASMASVIVAAGDRVVMPENSWIMIHKPWAALAGNQDELRNVANVLESMTNAAVRAYKAKTGDKSTDEDILDMMDKETWLDASTAVEKGFADEIEKPIKAEARLDGKKFGSIPDGAKVFFSAIHREEKTLEELMQNDPLFTSENIQSNQGVYEVKTLLKMAFEAGKKISKEIDEKIDMLRAKYPQSMDMINKAYAEMKDLSVIEPEEESQVEAMTASALNQVAARVNTLVFDLLEAVPPAKSGDVKIIVDEREKFCKASTAVLMRNVGGVVPESHKKDLADADSDGLGRMGLQGFFRGALKQAGVRNVESMTNAQVYDKAVETGIFRGQVAQGPGDFSNVLADVANKELQDAWTTSPTTWRAWAGTGTVPDFKTLNLVRVSEMSDLEAMEDGEGFPFGALTDSKETAQARTYGVAWSIGRKTIINDDLNALSTAPRKMARSADRTLNRQVYTTLYGTAMAGPTMNEDSVAMFSTARTPTPNFVGSGSGLAPSNATLSTLRRYLMKQTTPSPDGSQSKNSYTYAEPRVVLYHMNLDKAVENLIEPAYNISQNTTASSNDASSRQFIRRLLPVSDPVLDELMDVNNHEGYYLIADPMDAALINVYFLSGSTSPTLRRKVGDVAEPLGLTFDIYHDWAVGAADFRGGAANYGK